MKRVQNAPTPDDPAWQDVRNMQGKLRCRIHTATGVIYLEFVRRAGQPQERREVIVLPDSTARLLNRPDTAVTV